MLERIRRRLRLESLLKGRTLVVLEFVALVLFWLLTRYQAIRHNVLFFDDYAIPSDAAKFYVGSYRPLVYAEYLLWESIIKDHFWTLLPKLTGMLYIAGVASALSSLLRSWGVRRAIAFGTALFFLSHPILADVALWQSLHAAGLALLLITVAFRVWERSIHGAALWSGCLLLLAGLMGYQIYAAAGLVILVAEIAIKSLTGTIWFWRRTVIKSAALAGMASVQVIYMEISRRLLPIPDERGLAAPANLADYAIAKYHGVLNMVVNAFMPLAAFYSDVQTAWSGWKWIPITIALLTLLAGWARRVDVLRTVWLSSMIVILPICATLPTLVTSHNPHAWRVSVPVVIAFALAIVPLVLMLDNSLHPKLEAGLVVLLFITCLTVPVAVFDSGMRAAVSEQDRSVASKLHHRSPPTTFYQVELADPPDDYIEGFDRTLTWGYMPLDPYRLSAYNNPWIAKHLLKDYQGIPVKICDQSGSASERCDDAAVICENQRVQLKMSGVALVTRLGRSTLCAANVKRLQ